MRYLVEIRFINSIDSIKVYDESDLSLEEYSKDIKTVFKSNTITTLTFQTDSITLRPSTISSIYVSQVQTLKIPESSQPFKQDIIED